ncbi:MAG TPA: MFS transporter, partial [bacterium]|nr:MFS transporter [bacterium]
GLFLFSPVAGSINYRLGSPKVLFYGLLGMIAGIFLVAAGINFSFLVSGMIIMGIANAFIINANMTLLSELFPGMIRRIISLYSALYFGACALFSPLIGNWLKLSSEKGWDFLSFRMPFIVLLLVFIYFAAVTYRFIIPEMLKHPLEMPVESKARVNSGKAGFAKWFWVPLLGFFHGLMYIVMISWLSPMAKEKFGANEFQGSLFVGVATLGMGLGRLFIAGVKLPWEDRKILAGGTIAGGLIFFAGLFAPFYTLSLLLIGTGSFIASTSFPCISSLAGELFPDMKSKIFGYMYATYAIAGIVGTPFAGILADRGISFSWILTISSFSALIIGIVSLIWKYTEKRGKDACKSAKNCKLS